MGLGELIVRNSQNRDKENGLEDAVKIAAEHNFDASDIREILSASQKAGNVRACAKTYLLLKNKGHITDKEREDFKKIVYLAEDRFCSEEYAKLLNEADSKEKGVSYLLKRIEKEICEKNYSTAAHLCDSLAKDFQVPVPTESKESILKGISEEILEDTYYSKHLFNCYKVLGEEIPAPVLEKGVLLFNKEIGKYLGEGNLKQFVEHCKELKSLLGMMDNWKQEVSHLAEGYFIADKARQYEIASDIYRTIRERVRKEIGIKMPRSPREDDDC